MCPYNVSCTCVFRADWPWTTNWCALLWGRPPLLLPAFLSCLWLFVSWGLRPGELFFLRLPCSLVLSLITSRLDSQPSVQLSALDTKQVALHRPPYLFLWDFKDSLLTKIQKCALEVAVPDMQASWAVKHFQKVVVEAYILGICQSVWAEVRGSWDRS